MSSDLNGAAGRATTAAQSASTGAAADGGAGQGGTDDAQAEDPWFAPGPKKAAGPGDPDGRADVGAAAVIESTAPQAEWFLRTGRVGLHPDSESFSDDMPAGRPADHHELRVTAAGAPPWAGESTDVAASSPPPWETGPWPGPGGVESQGSLGDGSSPAAPSGATAMAADAASARAAMETAGTGDALARWPARTVVTAGLIPLVVPGLVLGALSLRQAASQSVRKASWLAIGASLAWAAIIVVVVAGVFGGSAPRCGGYPAAVHQAYAKALADLNSNAPAAAQAADLEAAASQANSFAAAAGQISVRTALFTMANDMAQARADVVAGRPIPATLRQHLADDGVVPAGSCAS
jgi:hypothetical protein